MTWELYEVWTVNEDGHEELLDTTKSLKEAQAMARNALTDDVVECIIFKEEDGELYEVEVVA